MENKINEANIETFIYDKNAVISLLNLIDTIKINGIENIQAMFNIIQILNSPIKEDTMIVDKDTIKKVG